MTRAAARIEAPPRADPVAVFVARCEARALLWQAGELELHDAVDELQASAAASGLVDQLGQNGVQAIMAEAFAAVRDNFTTGIESPAVRDEDPLLGIAERIRPLLTDGSRSTKERVRILWAAAKAARRLPAADVRAVFMALAVESNLIDRLGRWTGDDVRADVRRHGAQDVEHVIAWALRGWNPFERGPLK
jgi:hypothetical protein